MRGASWRPRGGGRTPYDGSRLEGVRLGIPKGACQAEPREDPAHLVRLRAARIRVQPGRIPRVSQPPELIECHEGPYRQPPLEAPFTNPFFRPEVEHRTSREYDVVPPFRR